MPHKAAKGKKNTPQAQGKMKAPKPAPVEESGSDEDDSSDEEMAVDMPKSASKPKAVAQKRKPADDDSDDSDDSSDDEEPEVKSPVKKAKLTNAAPPPQKMDEDEDSEDDDDDSDSADDKPAPKAKQTKQQTPAKPQQQKKQQLMEADESDDDSDDSDEDDVPVPQAKKAKQQKPAKPQQQKKQQQMEAEESDDDSDDSEEDDDDSDEPAPKAKQTKQQKPAKQQVEADESDEDSDEDDEDSEEDSEEEEVPKKKKEKKKKNGTVEAESDSATIFIGNIPKGFTDKKLKKFFEKRGIPIAEIRRSKAEKPFAYADLANPGDMKKAVALNGQTIEDREIKIEKAKPKPPDTPKQESQFKSNSEKLKERDDRRKTFEQQDEKILFVKNLPESATEDSIKEFFPDAQEVRLPRKPDNSHKGFAFIVFEDKSKVEEVMNEKQGADFDGSALYLDFSGKKSKFQSPGGDRRKSTGESGKTKVLFVKNLSFDTDENALKGAFEGCASARIARFQDTNKHRGFGFVEFNSAEDAKEAHDKMQGETIDGREVFIDFAGDRGSGGGGGGRGGFRGGRGRGDRGRGGRGFGGRGGRGFGGRGGRGFGGGRGGGGERKGNIQEFRGKKKTFQDDSD